jgi:hypothetical protein
MRVTKMLAMAGMLWLQVFPPADGRTAGVVASGRIEPCEMANAAYYVAYPSHPGCFRPATPGNSRVPSTATSLSSRRIGSVAQDTT